MPAVGFSFTPRDRLAGIPLGDGQFDVGVDVPDAYGSHVAIGDIDGDGLLDIVSSGRECYAGDIPESWGFHPKTCNGQDAGCLNIAEGDGDCDTNYDIQGDCMEGLVCGKNNCEQKSGLYDPKDDCCARYDKVCDGESCGEGCTRCSSDSTRCCR